MKLKSLAIPIRCTDYSESSQIVSFFTREYGLVDGIAKGAYRPKSPFQGPFDLLTLCEIILLRNNRNDDRLAILTEAIQLSSFRGQRNKWDRYMASTHVLEFLRAVATAENTLSRLFDRTVETLVAIADSEEDAELTDLLAAFELTAFRTLGMSAEIDCCVECGRPWRQVNQAVFLCLDHMGVLCPSCRQKKPAAAGRMVPGRLVQRINSLATEDPTSSTPFRQTQTEPELRKELTIMLSLLRESLLERRFVTREYLAPFF